MRRALRRNGRKVIVVFLYAQREGSRFAVAKDCRVIDADGGFHEIVSRSLGMREVPIIVETAKMSNDGWGILPHQVDAERRGGDMIRGRFSTAAVFRDAESAFGEALLQTVMFMPIDEDLRESIARCMDSMESSRGR